MHKTSNRSELCKVHRKRIELEEKAKVVVIASVWGTEFVQFLAPLDVLPRSIWKNWMNLTFSFKETKAKQLAQEGIEQILSPKQKRRPLPYLLILSFCYGNVGL